MVSSIEDLVPARQRDFGAGSLIICDRLVRIYIAAGIATMLVSGQASTGEGTAGQLASIAQHASLWRVGKGVSTVFTNSS